MPARNPPYNKQLVGCRPELPGVATNSRRIRVRPKTVQKENRPHLGQFRGATLLFATVAVTWATWTRSAEDTRQGHSMADGLASSATLRRPPMQ